MRSFVLLLGLRRPQPLKFLSPFYGALCSHYATMPTADSERRRLLADILSVIGMCFGKEGERESLGYKLRGHLEDLASWGHEYLRALAGEIALEYNERLNASKPDEDAADDAAMGDVPALDVADLLILVDGIVPYHLQHNSEPEAVDLLFETQQLYKLTDEAGPAAEHVTKANYARIVLYILGIAKLSSDPDDHAALLDTAYTIAKRQEDHVGALRVALLQAAGGEDMARVKELFAASKGNITVQKQMGFLLGRHHANFDAEDEDCEDEDEINKLISNGTMHELFLGLARELDVEAPKTPEDIYKSHLGDTNSLTARRGGAAAAAPESARQNLASTYVNAFVNAGYSKDALMTVDANPDWLFNKNKEKGKLAAAASLGMIMQWDTEEGVQAIDKFLYSGEEVVKAGAYLALGICSTGVRDEFGAAFALLQEQLVGDDASKSHLERCAALFGMGLAKCCSRDEEVSEVLMPSVKTDETEGAAGAGGGEGQSFLECCLASLSLGMAFAGSCDAEVSSTLMQRLMEATPAELDQTHARFLALGLGLLFLGAQDKADACLEAVRTVDHPMGRYCAVTLSSCAYAGTGNALKVQELLHIIAEGLEEKKEAAKAEGEKEQTAEEKAAAAEEAEKKRKEGGRDMQIEDSSAAVLGIALICMGEGISSQMTLRTMDHILQYGERHTRLAVPLALALLSISKPEYAIIDTLSRLSHDHDAAVAMSACLSLGLIGAGTNNSRIAGLLRQLSEFYAREPNQLYVVRLAQGLLHAGKGLVSFSPFHSDRLLMSHSAIAGLLTVLHASIDMAHTLLGDTHYLLYALAAASKSCCRSRVAALLPPAPSSRWLVTHTHALSHPMSARLPAVNPRMLICLDQDLNPLQTSVRVGQAVDTVGQAGKPKTISGFQTHTTPVLLGVGDRAELASDKYLSTSSILEGFVILTENPDFQEDTEESKHLR